MSPMEAIKTMTWNSTPHNPAKASWLDTPNQGVPWSFAAQDSRKPQKQAIKRDFNNDFSVVGDRENVYMKRERCLAQTRTEAESLLLVPAQLRWWTSKYCGEKINEAVFWGRGGRDSVFAKCFITGKHLLLHYPFHPLCILRVWNLMFFGSAWKQAHENNRYWTKLLIR